MHFPIIYGLGINLKHFTIKKTRLIDQFKGYNIKQSKAFMCNKFMGKGPDLSVRGARHFSPNGVINKSNCFQLNLIDLN